MAASPRLPLPLALAALCLAWAEDGAEMMDCYGKDVGYRSGAVTMPATAADAQACQSICGKTLYCEHFTYWATTKACWLLGLDTAMVPVPGAVSGPRSCGSGPFAGPQSTLTATTTVPAASTATFTDSTSLPGQPAGVPVAAPATAPPLPSSTTATMAQPAGAPVVAPATAPPLPGSTTATLTTTTEAVGTTSLAGADWMLPLASTTQAPAAPPQTTTATSAPPAMPESAPAGREAPGMRATDLAGYGIIFGFVLACLLALQCYDRCGGKLAAAGEEEEEDDDERRDDAGSEAWEEDEYADPKFARAGRAPSITDPGAPLLAGGSSPSLPGQRPSGLVFHGGPLHPEPEAWEP